MVSLIISLQVTIILSVYFIITYLDTKEKERQKQKNSTKISIVFWAHFESNKVNSYRMSRFDHEKTASDFFDWHLEKLKELGSDAIMTNGGIIR
jgi:predicted membrane protein